MTSELFVAVAAGDRETVDRLVTQRPALLDARNDDGVSVIVWACYVNQPELAAELADRVGEATLDLDQAAALGRAERVRQLLDAGCGVDDHTPDGFTPLHYAAFFGHLDLARLLVHRGATLSCVAKNDLSVTPLHSALAGRHREIARLLIEAGADVSARQQLGWTPLHTAAQNGDAELVELLLARGADAAVCTEDGVAPADLADSGGHPDLAALLRRAARR
jgi:ankyrin repeat protein